MKHLIFFTSFFFSFILKAEVTLKTSNSEEKDLGCITLLKIASDKSKKDGATEKYEKLKKLQNNYLKKYKEGNFSKQKTTTKLDEHNLKIKEEGQRYVNKGLQKCGLK